MEEEGGGGTAQCAEGVSRRPRRVTRPTKKAVESQEQNEIAGNSEQDMQSLLLMILNNQKEEREVWKRERELLVKAVESLRQTVESLSKDQQHKLEAQAQKIEALHQTLEKLAQGVSASPSWAEVASQPSRRMTPSSGLPSQPSVSPDSSASRQRPKQLASVTLDVSRVTGSMDNADEVKARISRALSQSETTKDIKCTGVLRTPGEHKIKILVKTDEEAARLRTDDSWVTIQLRGARMLGEQWYPIKVDRVNKLNIKLGPRLEIPDEIVKQIGQENNVTITKMRWLSKPSDKIFGSLAVYLHKKEEADALLDRQVMDFKGEAGFTRQYERRLVPTRCFKCHQYGHQEFRCHNQVKCGNCAQEGHGEKECSSTVIKCAACKGPHKASDRGCKVYKDHWSRMNPALDA